MSNWIYIYKNMVTENCTFLTLLGFFSFRNSKVDDTIRSGMPVLFSLFPLFFLLFALLWCGFKSYWSDKTGLLA